MSAPLRALHVHAGNLYGGIETILVTLARLAGLEPGIEHSFALCFEGRLAQQLDAAGARRFRLGAVRVSRPWTVLRGRRALASRLSADPADVVLVHSPWSHAVFAPAVRAAHRPLVFWQHFAATGRHVLERWAAMTPPDHVICNSCFTATTTKLLFPEAASSVLYAPVPLAAPVESAVRQRRRETHATALDAVVIVQVSRLEAWKGHAVLLDALSRLRDQPDWTCWVVGGAQRPEEAAYLAGLRTRAESLGISQRMRFLGQCDDVPAVLGAADVFCQPNTSPEPFGIAFVEALAHGIPVVTSGIGAASEIIDSSCGILVPPGDHQALAEALRLLISDRRLRKALATQALRRAAALCDPPARLRDIGATLRAVHIAYGQRSLHPPADPKR